MMNFFRRGKERCKESHRADYSYVIMPDFQQSFVYLVILILILLVFGRDDSERKIHYYKRKKLNDNFSEEAANGNSIEEVSTDTIPYLYLLILAEVLNRIKEGSRSKNPFKAVKGERKSAEAGGFNLDEDSILKTASLVPLLGAQFYVDEESSKQEVYEEKERIESEREYGCMAAPDLADANKIKLNSNDENKDSSVGIPSVIRSEYKGVKITAMLPTGITVTGDVVFNFKDIIALKCDDKIVFINESNILSFY